MENKYWKPKLTEENQHRCMDNTKWDETKPAFNYVKFELLFPLDKKELKENEN